MNKKTQAVAVEREFSGVSDRVTKKKKPQDENGDGLIYAVEFPKLPPDEAAKVKSWPVVIRFPSTADAMELFALAKAGSAARRPSPWASTRDPDQDVPNGTNEQMSVAEVASVLGMTNRTIRDYIKSGELPATKVGKPGKERRYRIRRADVEQYLAARRVNPETHDVNAEADAIIRSLDREEV